MWFNIDESTSTTYTNLNGVWNSCWWVSQDIIQNISSDWVAHVGKHIYGIYQWAITKHNVIPRRKGHQWNFVLRSLAFTLSKDSLSTSWTNNSNQFTIKTASICACLLSWLPTRKEKGKCYLKRMLATPSEYVTCSFACPVSFSASVQPHPVHLATTIHALNSLTTAVLPSPGYNFPYCNFELHL